MAALMGLPFSVVTSVAAAIPVTEGNIARLGFDGLRASVRASHLPVLDIDAGAPETIDRLADVIDTSRGGDGSACVTLGCAGMGGVCGARLNGRSRGR